MPPSMEADTGAGEAKMTKAQRRKLAKESDKNKWPQHPNIRSSTARAKAYLRTAGLVNSKKTADVDPQLDLQSPSVKFGRLLGGTDARVRHAAVLQLQSYLKARCDVDAPGFSELDLLKLWKGLWHTLYMADKVPVQDELAQQIAKLLWCFAGTPEEDEFAAQAYMNLYANREEEYLAGEAGEDSENDSENSSDRESENSDNGPDVTMEEVSNTLEEDDEEEDLEQNNEQDDDEESMDDSEVPHCRGAHLASLFVRTFFRTVRREWGNMDKYRVDKFYTLCRYMLSQVLEYMAVRHWNLGILRLFNDAIYQEVLSQTPNGLRFHLIDITLDELAKINATVAPMPLTEATFLDCLEPYFAMVQSAKEEIVQKRVVEKVLEKFLFEYSVVSDRALNKDDEEESKLVMDQIHVGTIAEFIFDIASDGDTGGLYRKGLYQLHKTYVRRLKQVGTDVEMEHAHDDEEPVVEMEEEAEEEAPPKSTPESKQTVEPEKSSSQKKKKKKDKKAVTKEEPPPTAKEPTKEADADDAPSSKKKRKKKKKKPNNDAGDKSDGKEEEITISVKDQAAAKAALKVKKAQKKKDEETTPPSNKRKKNSASEKETEEERGKRVKFGDLNRARSWKASMKGLRTMDSPVTDITPEKGILLKKLPAKSKKDKKGKKTGKRKKAVDYF